MYLSEAHEGTEGTAYWLCGVGNSELPLHVHSSVWKDPEGERVVHLLWRP